MKPEQRELYLKIGAAALVALIILYKLVIDPAFGRWHDQSQRISDLRTQVQNGQRLVDRENDLRNRWAGMMHENLPADNSAAEVEAFKAVARWERDGHVVFTNLTKRWENHEEGYDTLEMRGSLNGDQTSIARFIYEMETDSIPVSLDKCDITPRDNRGTQLTLAATFTFLRLPEGNK